MQSFVKLDDCLLCCFKWNNPSEISHSIKHGQHLRRSKQLNQVLYLVKYLQKCVNLHRIDRGLSDLYKAVQLIGDFISQIKGS